MLKKILVEETLRDIIRTNERMLDVRTPQSTEYKQGKVDGLKEALEIISKMPSVSPISHL